MSSTSQGSSGGDANGDSGLHSVIDRLAAQRYVTADADVAQLRAEHPDDTDEELADRLIRRYTKNMAVGGAVTGGAAAAPVAGVAVAAASAGADAAFSVSRLGEMILGIGIIYGHSATTVDERRTAIVTVMGLADGAAVGVSGLAARAGSKGGARLLARLPSDAATAATGKASRRALAKLTTGKGPWSVTALIPYGIGAGVGAAGNALLARAVGRAAKEYFTATELPTETRQVHVDVDLGDSEVLDDDPPPPPSGGSAGAGAADHDDIVDAEIVD